MIVFKYLPKKEKIKKADNIHELMNDLLNDTRTQELYQMMYAAIAERNVNINPELNRMFGMRIERR